MYTFNSRVRYSETDEKGLLSIAGIVNYFQDASTFQSEDLGAGVEVVSGLGLVWVLNSWQIVVHQRPKLSDRIVVGTFPTSFKGFMGHRNFFLEDAQGNRLVEANSIWTLLDINKGLPARVPAVIYEKYTLGEPLAMPAASRKITVPDGGVEEEAFLVGRQHLDGNHHVNNGQYIAMAMGYLPEDFAVKQMRAEYRRQALLHDTIVPVVTADEGKRIVSLNGADGQAYAVVEFCA